jgi:hypothetical protein
MYQPTGDDSEWTAAQKRGIARKFRHHVQARWNPKGRIVRLPCVFYGGYARGRHVFEEPPMCLGDLVDAHHVDYARPFAVVWLCRTCHALVHRRKLRVVPSMVCDYSSLVQNLHRKKAGHGNRSRSRELRPGRIPGAVRSPKDGRAYEPAPF